ncbi:copper chaperone PCu(A)C [Novosphingobium sp. ZN18A2]|uniref:copper chaperone PCu(A)C n=1 Tax=Novosphingobium sp. ZN18A2 TaxID=3079861 RepID=UPI0030D3D425
MSLRPVGIAAAPVLSLGLALALAGCGTNAPEPAASESAAAAEAPGPAAPAGVSVTDATVKLPAATGRPGAAYFTVTQNGGEPHRIASVHVDGVGRTEMHETVMDGKISTMRPVADVAVEPGKPLVFKPGGLHVMLFDFDGSLKAGGTTELTVTFENGDKASVPADVVTAGEMPGAMDHSGHM